MTVADLYLSEVLDRRLTDPDPRIWDKTPADVALLLDHPELFDVVDVHSLGDYTEIPPTIVWLRQQMAARGYDRPIWIGDSFSGVGLNGWGPATCPRRPNSGWLCYPATEADRCRVAATLQALADSNAPDHQAALDWIHADSAAGIVRRTVVAAGEGLAGINIGNVEDWEPLMLTQGGAGTSPWQGMVDRVLLTRRFQGYRPAYYALQQVAGVIRRYTAVERLPAEAREEMGEAIRLNPALPLSARRRQRGLHRLGRHRTVASRHCHAHRPGRRAGRNRFSGSGGVDGDGRRRARGGDCSAR